MQHINENIPQIRFRRAKALLRFVERIVLFVFRHDAVGQTANCFYSIEYTLAHLISSLCACACSMPVLTSLIQVSDFTKARTRTCLMSCTTTLAQRSHSVTKSATSTRSSAWKVTARVVPALWYSNR